MTKTICPALALLTITATLTACSSSEERYNNYHEHGCRVPTAYQHEDWSKLKYKFAIHIPDSGRNYIIHHDGHDDYKSFRILKFVMDQKFNSFEVWINALLEKRLEYGKTIEEFMARNGYICIGIKKSHLPDGDIYKMEFVKNSFDELF